MCGSILFPYWHVDGVVEAGVFIPQLVGGGKIPSFLVGLTEETSKCLSRWIHIECPRDVQSGAHRCCKGIQQD